MVGLTAGMKALYYTLAGIGANQYLGNPVGKGIRRSGKLGKGLATFWDTHIGRKGLIGEGGEMLGLWESGTTADRKRGLLNALDKDIANINENNATTKKLALDRFNSVNLNENKKVGGILGSINMSSNLAQDSSRYMRGKEAIQNAINKSNINYQDTITRNLERDAQASDRIMSLETRKEQIRNS
tara:strand:+ start:4177 stop:4731 length:555 start_codon:yes stop_codon:yes gene_type:complete